MRVAPAVTLNDEQRLTLEQWAHAARASRRGGPRLAAGGGPVGSGDRRTVAGLESVTSVTSKSADPLE